MCRPRCPRPAAARRAPRALTLCALTQAYCAAHEKLGLHAPLVETRGQELAAADARLAAAGIVRTAVDLELGPSVRVPARARARLCPVHARPVHARPRPRALVSCACAPRAPAPARALTRRPHQLVRSVLAAPRTSKLPGYPSIAIIKSNPAYKTYLHRGKYYSEFMTRGGVTGSMAIDFVSASEAMLREGQRVFLNLDAHLYSELRILVPHLAVEDAATHQSLHAEDGSAQLEAFYVLGKRARLPACAPARLSARLRATARATDCRLQATTRT